jgi:hypothetical protein
MASEGYRHASTKARATHMNVANRPTRRAIAQARAIAMNGAGPAPATHSSRASSF